MQIYHPSQQFSPYSVTKQTQPGQIQKSTPFDEDNETSKSGSQIFNQVQVGPQNRINLDELFGDNQIKSNQEFPFWDQDSQQGQPQINNKNAENSLFNLEQNSNNQIIGISSQNQTQRPQGQGQVKQYNINNQNQILDEFDDIFEQNSKVVSQQGEQEQQINEIQQKQQLPIDIAQQQQINPIGQNKNLDEFSFPFFQDTLPPFQTNQNTTQGQGIQTTNQQIKDANQSRIDDWFNQPLETNQQQQYVDSKMHTPPNQSQIIQSQKSLDEKHIPNSNNSSQIKQQPQQVLQIPVQKNILQKEVNKQSSQQNFSIDLDQGTKQQKSVSNSQRDDSDLPWDEISKQQTQQQAVDFFQGPNFFNINTELDKQPAQQVQQQNKDEFNLWQTDNNNQFNNNIFQLGFFNDNTNLQQNKDKKENQAFPSLNSFDQLNFNEYDNKLQFQTQNQQGSNQYDILQWKQQNTIQSESDDVQGQFQQKLDVPQKQDDSQSNIQNQHINQFEFPPWNEQQIKDKSQSQSSMKDGEENFEQGWNNFQQIDFQQNNQYSNWDGFDINKIQKEQSLESFHKDEFDQFQQPPREVEGSQLEQSIHNSESPTQQITLYGNQGQEKVNKHRFIQEEDFDNQKYNQKINLDSFEQRDNFIDESKVIQQSQNKTQSFEFPSSIQMGIHSVRESKEDNKEQTYTEQIMELLLPKIAEITQTLRDDLMNNVGNQEEGQNILYQGIQNILQNEKRRFGLKKEKYLNQQVQTIEDIIIEYDNKTLQLQEQFIKVKEEQQKERQKSTGNMSLDSIDIGKSKQINDQIEESPIKNIQLQVSPSQYTPQNSQEKPNIPFQSIHQTQSKFINESVISQDNKEELIKLQTNQVFQRQFLKGLYSQLINSKVLLYFIKSIYSCQRVDLLIYFLIDIKFLILLFVCRQQNIIQNFIQIIHLDCIILQNQLQQNEIQKFKKQCLSDQVILLETQELIITQNSDRNQNTNQGFRITLIFQNKGRNGIQNLIVCLDGKKLKNDFEAYPQKIIHPYLSPGDSIKQEIRFKYYDQFRVYLNCYLKYTVIDNRFYWSQGQQGIQNNESMYRSQMNYQGYNNSYYNQYQQGRGSTQYDMDFKITDQFIIGRPANRFFTYNYWTAEELNEYNMRYQGEEFPLKSLEELIIYHPWLVKIDSQTLCGKVFIRLEDSDYDFVVKIILKDQKGIIKMNRTDIDQKLCEHLLSFLSFLFIK